MDDLVHTQKVSGGGLVLPPCEHTDIFLCHNSRDKPVVRQVAEGLELEFGLPHFLDAYAIPTGEAFLPWIERALATSSGCAIFLGANGWGETHFWEAERALERYRVDSRFKVVPVALPGIRDEDMKRLGAGTLFQEVNWADFRDGSVDPDAILKLRAAMLGQPLQRDRGPARLTPYVVRRDAGRWEESRRSDRSILYRGRQLKEAHALRASQPDLVAGDAIFAFLAESAAAQTRRLRLIVFLSIAATAVIGLLALRAEKDGRLALARFVASEARQAPSPDTGLLLAVQAASIVDTPEAYGAVLERLDAQPFLRHMLRIGEAEISSLAFDPGGKLLYVGTTDRKVVRLDLQTMAQTPIEPSIGSTPMSMDIDARSGEVWVGAQNGHVYVLGPDGTRTAAVSLGMERLPVIALQVDPTGRWVAVGNHNHQLVLLDREKRAILWTKAVAAQRVTAVSFSVDGERIAAASSDGAIDVFQTSNGEPIRSMSTAGTGNGRALQFSRNGDLRAIDDGNVFWVFASGETQGKARRMAGSALSVAAIGPRVERGPVQRLDLVALGFGSGDVSLTPLREDAAAPTLIRAHARTVYAVALSQDGQLAASGAGDGSVALWDMQRRSLLFAPSSTPGGEFVDLAYDGMGRTLAVTASDDAALLVGWTPSGWETLADLMSLTVTSAGQQSVGPAESRPGSDGFEPVPEKLVSAASFAPGATHLVWATRAGALLWTPWPLSGAPRVLRDSGRVVATLALGDGGRTLFAVEGEATLLVFDLTDPSSSVRRYELPAPVRSVVAAAGGRAVLVALEDETLRRVDFAGESPRETSKVALSVTVGHLAREPGSDLMVVAGAGSSAGIDVGVVDGNFYRRLHSRRVGGAVSTMALARAAGLVAAGDHDGRLHLWDMETLIPMASLQVSADALTAMAISQDGRELSVASLGGDVFRLALDRKRWLAEACRLVGRELTLAEWVALVPGSRPREACGLVPRRQP